MIVSMSLVDIGINSTLLKSRIATYSGLNPRDGGAWWAAVYGVTQSRTRLMDLAAAAGLNILPTECRHMIQSNHR